MNEKKLKHLEFIQNVISRMGNNLFYLRGWVITLIAGILVLLTKIGDGKMPIVFLAFITVLFWAYDGYFLSLEKKYRKLYDKVRVMKEKDIDFSMSVREFNKEWDYSILACIFSPTLRYFYGPLMIAILYVIFFLK